MEFQTLLAEHLLTHTTAVVSEETATYLQQQNINIQTIFQGKIIVTNNLLDPAFYRTNEYYVLIMLPNDQICKRPFWTGCTILLQRGDIHDHLWFVSRLREDIEKHFSWYNMLEDELMGDSEFRMKMLHAVVEELEEISDIHIPLTCSQFEKNELTTIWKLSHSFKTTARLVGGLELESHSTFICDILRPVVRGGLPTLNISNEKLYNKIRELIASVAMLSFFIQNTITILCNKK